MFYLCYNTLRGDKMTEIITAAAQLSAGQTVGIISIAFLAGLSAGLFVWFFFIRKKK